IKGKYLLTVALDTDEGELSSRLENLITNATTFKARAKGIELLGNHATRANQFEVSRNSVHMTMFHGYLMTGINLSKIETPGDAFIYTNFVDMPYVHADSAVGISVTELNANPGAHTYIGNCGVALATHNGYFDGLSIRAEADMKVYHNSVNVYVQGNPPLQSDALEIMGSGNGTVDLINNIFANKSDGRSFVITGNVNTWNFSDYNCYEALGPVLGYAVNAVVPDLPAFQAMTPGFDLNSIETDPQFLADDTLKLDIGSPLRTHHASHMLFFGPTQPLKTDFEGSLRNHLPREIGADEVANPFNKQTLPEQNTTHAHPIDIRIFPNPATDHLNIEWPGADGPLDIQFFNLSGQLLHHQSSSTFKTRLPLTDVPAGIYLLRVRHGAHMHAQKIVVH
ncbi:MAG: T9SS type A sorting domain-containing protein, partial [Bacteroidota bacterium]